MHTQNCSFVITENWWCFVMFGHSDSWLCWHKCIVWIKAWSEWKCFTSKWNFWLAPPHSERIFQSTLPGYSHQRSCLRSFWSCLSKWHQAIRILLWNTAAFKMAKKNAIIESIHFSSSVLGRRRRTFIKAEYFLKKEDKQLLEVSHFVHSEHVALARLWEGKGALGCVWVYLPRAECTFTFCKSEASACESDIWAAEVTVRRCLWFFFKVQNDLCDLKSSTCDSCASQSLSYLYHFWFINQGMSKSYVWCDLWFIFSPLSLAFETWAEVWFVISSPKKQHRHRCLTLTRN